MCLTQISIIVGIIVGVVVAVAAIYGIIRAIRNKLSRDTVEFKSIEEALSGERATGSVYNRFMRLYYYESDGESETVPLVPHHLCIVYLQIRNAADIPLTIRSVRLERIRHKRVSDSAWYGKQAAENAKVLIEKQDGKTEYVSLLSKFGFRQAPWFPEKEADFKKINDYVTPRIARLEAQDYLEGYVMFRWPSALTKKDRYKVTFLLETSRGCIKSKCQVSKLPFGWAKPNP